MICVAVTKNEGMGKGILICCKDTEPSVQDTSERRAPISNTRPALSIMFLRDVTLAENEMLS